MNVRWLLRLYPRAWRERYGDEYLALLEAVRPTLRVWLDCVAGALDAHLRPPVSPGPRARPAESPASSVGMELPVVSESPSPRPPRLVPHIPLGGRESVVDEIVRRAMERGEFDNLKGAGRPMELDDNPLAGDWSVANSIVKNAGETAGWIALGREIDADMAAFERGLRVAAEEQRDRLAQASSPLDRSRCEAARLRDRGRLLADAEQLDRKLADFNWQVASLRLDWLGRPRLSPSNAAARFEAVCPPEHPSDRDA